jgi:poly-gamma-glutamate synthesis protein (capsule biosynthesis protein)
LKKNHKRRIFGIIIALEVLLVSVIFLIVILKGDISFHTIGAKEVFDGAAGTEDAQPSPSPVPTGSTTTPAAGENDSLQTGDAAASGTAGNGTDIPGFGNDSTPNGTADEEDSGSSEEAAQEPKDVYDTITISAAGDVTLGRDYAYAYERSFDHELVVQGNDYGYFFRNVKDIFAQDDITVVNLETTLTTAKVPAEKKFRFKADPSYVEILKEGDIETVSVANNHSHDYLEQGYQDTIDTLTEAGVGYFGNGYTDLREVRGIKIGFAGFVSWEVSDRQKEEIKETIKELRKDGADIVIVMFHWGIERDYYPNSVQTELAHYSIDQGADLILGGHPHVVQGIEEYNGKNIVYSLGNFSFGGNKNPGDKDSMVYIQKFNFKNGELISQENEVIPCSISSVKDRNNYQPTPLQGEEKERVRDKIEEFSKF